MSELFSVINMYVDVSTRSIVTADGGNLSNSELFKLYRRDRAIVRTQFYNNAEDRNEFALPANTTFYFAMRQTTTPGIASENPVITDNSGFSNATYWPGESITSGKIGWLITTATNELDEVFTAASNPDDIAFTGDLFLQTPGEDPSIVCQWEITVRNLWSQYGTSSPLATSLLSSLIRQDTDANTTTVLLPDGTPIETWSMP